MLPLRTQLNPKVTRLILRSPEIMFLIFISIVTQKLSKIFQCYYGF